MKTKARVATPFGRSVVVLAVLALTLLVPVAAQGAQTHQLTARLHEGELGVPSGVAVDNSGGPSDGQIWLAAGNPEFPPTFMFLLAPNGEYSGDGFNPTPAFENPSQVAVDNATGDAYVLDTGNNTVYKFSGTVTGSEVTELWERNVDTMEGGGHGMRATALAVDPSTGHVAISTVDNLAFPGKTYGVVELNSDGTDASNTQVGTNPTAIGLAVGAAGEYFLVEVPNSGGSYGVDEYDHQGNFVRRIDDGGATGVAYDVAGHRLVVNDGSFISIYDASGAQVDKFGSGSLTNGSGVSINESTDVIYASDRDSGPSGTNNLSVFSPVALPNLTTRPASGIGQTAVTLNGDVDPAGGGEVTSCEFEFGETKGYGQTAPCSPSVPYATPTSVSADLTGLLPATEYHYRLSAGNANGIAHQEQDHTFVTSPGLPELLGQVVGDLGSENARIDATIKVMGADTKVTVEYGTTVSYGATTPVGGILSAAASPTDQAARVITVPLAGLATGTTYHFRVVLTNGAGTALGPDEVLHTYPPAENLLPDGRAYELVSPLNKNAHLIQHEYGISTDSGDGVLYATQFSIGNAASGALTFAVSRRIDGTWTPDDPFIRPNKVSDQNNIAMSWPSDDLNKVAFSAVGYAPGWEYGGVYLADRTQTILASPASLEPPVPAPGANGAVEHLLFDSIGGSPDLSALYFTYNGALLSADSVRVPALFANKAASGVYEFKEGHLEPADTLPDGTLDPEGAAPAATPNVSVSFVNQYHRPSEFLNEVSADGHRAFFVSPAPDAASPRPVELYVHRDGEASVLASRSQLTGEPAVGGVEAMPGATLSATPVGHSAHPYASASENGSHVFFESADQLTADAPANSAVKGYLFDVDTQRLEYVPGVTGTVIGVSDDGSRLFFASGEELLVWEAGVGVNPISAGSAAYQSYSITPDGSVLVFTPLTPPTGFNNGGTRQVYRYEVSGHRLDCISCAPAGATQGSPGYLAGENRLEASFGLTGQMKAPHYLADQGHRVFFETAQPLVAADTNGASDVYEWEGGGVYLISDGRSREGSFLVDNSASGNDVFFVTSEGLDPRDQDGSPDVYDARVGAGGNVSSPSRLCGSTCQGQSGGGAPKGSVGSADYEERKAGKSAAGIAVVSQATTGSNFSLTVKVPAAGRLSAAGPGVTKVAKDTTGAGKYRLNMRLDAKATKKLKRRGRFIAKVKVTFKAASGKSSTTSVSVTLKA